MRLEDENGNETDYSLFRWGPGGVWGFEEFERSVEGCLPDYHDHDVTMDPGESPRIAYRYVPLGVVEEFVSRGLVIWDYRFGAEAIALMRRNADARLTASVECSYDAEVGWYAVVRTVEIQEREPTEDDVAAACDIADTFIRRAEGSHRIATSCMSSWFTEGMVSADAFDWRGETRKELAVAHELPISQPNRFGKDDS